MEKWYAEGGKGAELDSVKYRKNSVPGKQRGKKYSEAVRTACMCDLLVVDNLSDVAKKHGVPESTLRTWKAKAEKLGPEGEKSLWAQARDEQVKQIALKAAQGARLGTALIVHRLEAGQRNMQRCDEIDRILLGSEKSEGLVLWGGGGRTAPAHEAGQGAGGTAAGRAAAARPHHPRGFCAGEYDADAYQRIRKGRGRAGRGAGRRETV